MNELRELARKLLTDESVKVVIGYEQGPSGARPAFITDPAQAEKLVFDTRCVQNLASYLSPRRKHVLQLGKPAIVAKGCDIRAIAGMIREQQVKRDDVVIIGVRCGGVGLDANCTELTSETVSDRCVGCDVREPKLYDHLIGSPQPEPPTNTRRADQIAALEAMTPEQRWNFWSEHFARCIRCHACREACPMCFCMQCTAEKTQPQWIDSSATPEANRAWQTMRVLHQAGRCVDCLECERACPADIPLGLLGRHVAEIVEKRFGYVAGEDPSVAAPLSVFGADDGEEFIL